jgi:hypothetical protein
LATDGLTVDVCKLCIAAGKPLTRNANDPKLP